MCPISTMQRSTGRSMARLSLAVLAWHVVHVAGVSAVASGRGLRVAQHGTTQVDELGGTAADQVLVAGWAPAGVYDGALYYPYVSNITAVTTFGPAPWDVCTRVPVPQPRTLTITAPPTESEAAQLARAGNASLFNLTKFAGRFEYSPAPAVVIGDLKVYERESQAYLLSTNPLPPALYRGGSYLRYWMDTDAVRALDVDIIRNPNFPYCDWTKASRDPLTGLWTIRIVGYVLPVGAPPNCTASWEIVVPGIAADLGVENWTDAPMCQAYTMPGRARVPGENPGPSYYARQTVLGVFKQRSPLPLALEGGASGLRVESYECKGCDTDQ